MNTGKRKQFVTDVCGASVNFEKKWHLPPNCEQGEKSAALLQRIDQHSLCQLPGSVDFQDHKSKVAADWEIVEADDQMELEDIKQKQLAALSKVEGELREVYGMGC